MQCPGLHPKQALKQRKQHIETSSPRAPSLSLSLSKINWLPPVPTRHYSVREERSYLAMVREMTQCLKVLATLSEDQCSVPSNHIRWLSVRHLMPCSCSSANCTRAHIDTSIHINKNLLKIEKWISNLRSTGSMKI